MSFVEIRIERNIIFLNTDPGTLVQSLVSNLNFVSYFRHLDCYHTLDEKSAAQARVQGYVVRELEEKVRR